MLRGNVSDVLLFKCNMEDMNMALARLRRICEKSWQQGTAHKSVRHISTSGSSTGQCFVTSWVIFEELANNPLVSNVSICRGVTRLNSASTLHDHCWVEGYLTDSRFLIDITLDQAGGPEIVFLNPSNRSQNATEYFCQRTYTSYSTLSNETQVRINRLKMALEGLYA